MGVIALVIPVFAWLYLAFVLVLNPVIWIVIGVAILLAVGAFLGALGSGS